MVVTPLHTKTETDRQTEIDAKIDRWTDTA